MSKDHPAPKADMLAEQVDRKSVRRKSLHQIAALAYAFLAILWTMPFHCNAVDAAEHFGRQGMEDPMFRAFAIDLEKVAAVDAVPLKKCFERHGRYGRRSVSLPVGFDRVVAAVPSAAKEIDRAIEVGNGRFKCNDVVKSVQLDVFLQQAEIVGVRLDGNNAGGRDSSADRERADIGPNVYHDIAGANLKTGRIVFSVDQHVFDERFIAAATPNTNAQTVAVGGFFRQAESARKAIPAGLHAVRQTTFGDELRDSTEKRLAGGCGLLVWRRGHGDRV